MYRKADLEGMKPLMDPPDRTGVVYFISAVRRPDYPVKIGYSTKHSLSRRLSQLQTAMPYVMDVLYVGVGTIQDEQSYHMRFDRQHLRGEWFERSPELNELIKDLRRANRKWRESVSIPEFRPGLRLSVEAI